MPGPQAPSVPLSADERPELLTRIRAHKTPQPFRVRAHMILPLAEGHTAREVARHVGTSRVTVRRGRRPGLARHACAVAARFQDAPRPGAPATFDVAPWCQIMA